MIVASEVHDVSFQAEKSKMKDYDELLGITENQCVAFYHKKSNSTDVWEIKDETEFYFVNTFKGRLAGFIGRKDILVCDGVVYHRKVIDPESNIHKWEFLQDL